MLPKLFEYSILIIIVNKIYYYYDKSRLNWSVQNNLMISEYISHYILKFKI